LDGLDEVPESDRAECVDHINRFIREQGLVRVVICSRTHEYSIIGRELQVEGVLELLAPGHQQIADYMARAGPAYSDIAAAIDTDPTLWELMRSPLVLSVVALTYRDRDATALCLRGTPSQRLTRLFEAYVQRMLDHRPSRYSPAQTRRWLGWLARSMDDRSQSEFHLDRLKPDWLPTPIARRLAAYAPALVVGVSSGVGVGVLIGAAQGGTFGLFFLLVFGLQQERLQPLATRLRVPPSLLVGAIVAAALGLPEVFTVGAVDGLVEGLFFGLFGGLTFQLRRTEPVEELSWVWGRAFVGLAIGAGAGLVCGFAYTLTSPRVDANDGLALGLFFGAALGVGYGLTPGLSERQTRPNEGIHRSLRHAAAMGAVLGLMFALPFGLAFSAEEALLFQAFFGLSAGLVFGGSVCLEHGAIRVLLALHGLAPYNCVDFLQDATNRLFLRQVGGGYIFIHRLLLEHFARADRDDRRPYDSGLDPPCDHA
jgi:hypothetical protein